jgi:hypothetical protein
MNLIERYVEKVGENLPAKSRTDIQAKIRSLIEDALEDRSAADGRAANESMTMEVLKKFGDPAKVAASYLPPRYLVGPRLFPTFILVMKIVTAVVTVIGLIQIGVSLGRTSLLPFEIGPILLQGLLNLLSSLLQVFGNIVLIFAILQWVVPEIKTKVVEWNPMSLNEMEDPQHIKSTEMIAEIAFTLVALLVFNFIPQWQSALFFELSKGSTILLPALTPAFYRWLPWIDIVWVLSIILSTVLLRRGKWDTASRWFSAALGIASMVLLYVLWSGPAIVSLDAPGAPAELRNTMITLKPLSEYGIRALLALIFVFEGVDLAKTLYRLLFKRPAMPVTGE